MFKYIALSVCLIAFAAAVSSAGEPPIKLSPGFDLNHPPKPGPECIPAPDSPGDLPGRSWYCDGPPPPDEPAAWEAEALDYVRAHHPDFSQAARHWNDIPLKYQREYQKFKNPNLVFEVDGIDVDELAAILERHSEELAKIPGNSGFGIGKEGIFVETDQDTSTLPRFLENAPIHYRPRPQGHAVDLGPSLSTRRKEQ